MILAEGGRAMEILLDILLVALNAAIVWLLWRRK